MIKILIISLSLFIFTVSCSKIRESAGVNRKNIDEFKVIENPPLIIPPDFNLLPPDQLSENKIMSAESDLAKEILFGLNEEIVDKVVENSTMENILNQTDAYLVQDNIREEINEEFASEKKISSKLWKNEVEILDSVKESERLRNKLLNNTNLDESVPKTKIKVKVKKKKRFLFF
ncbi:DUF3035 domain-containing protein [Alphaproteobacteria bacterium]|nr:DUF3035 domain-containing protein [Alphaproteobacteria bacterium]